MSQSPYIVDVDEHAFEQIVIENSYRAPVLVDFWADWCNPCKMLAPILHNLVEEFHGQLLLAKVNSDEQQGLSQRYGVRSLPTVKLFRNGEVVDEFTGVIPEARVREMLEPHLVRASDALAGQALAAYDEGRIDEALEIFQQVLEQDPDNHKVVLLFGRLLAEQGREVQALEVLNRLPEAKRQDADTKALITRLEFAGYSEGQADVQTLLANIVAEPNDNESRYLLANICIAQGDFENGLELLMEILTRDMGFKEGIAKETLFKVFEMLGGSGPLVSRYRSRMYNLMY